MAKKKKFYVVWEGNSPGIYESWTETQLQIKGYPGARYKSFPTLEDARAAFHGHYDDFVEKNKKTKTKNSASPETHPEIIWDSISVDAACSGNPGAMEYQGVNTRSGEQVFHQKFPLGTNNIGEFLAIVHALALFGKQGVEMPVYTDSRIAMGWVRQKKCRTNLKRTSTTEKLYQLIERAENWLKANTYRNQILKWDTEKWGEIPADFGRK